MWFGEAWEGHFVRSADILGGSCGGYYIGGGAGCLRWRDLLLFRRAQGAGRV
jgi:hypothetical protein